MNQLSNLVIDAARHRRAAAAARRWTAPDLRGQRGRAGALIRHWRRDAATGRLICAWAARKGAREAQPPSRLSKGKLKDSQHE
jgi:hypothetical protein